jgi:Cellulase (glycosyl hydrolase family 5)
MAGGPAGSNLARPGIRGRRAYRALTYLLAPIVAANLVAPPARLSAQACPYTGSPPGMPVTPSQNQRYFQMMGWGATPGTVPLVGMSYEYLCHVLIPASNPLATQYCQLTNYRSVFRQLSNAANNIVRINVIFNSSPGMSNGNGLPFADEEVFSLDSHTGQQGTIWDLSRIDQTYLANLEIVVCTAYTMGLVVQITLFDPWNHCWDQSPFNAANTHAGQGFTAPQYFASFDTPASQSDTNPKNKATRAYQVAAMGHIVDQIKKYPNIIWQIANEPDFIPTTNDILCPPVSGGTPIVAAAYVMDWQRYMIGQLLQHDSSHMIMVNGHETSPSTMAWSVVPSSFSNMSIESAHYTHNRPTPPFEGVLDIENDPTLATYLATWELGFDENQSLPNLDGKFSSRNPDDVRAEAWESVLGGSGLFNAYSGSMSTPSITASQQLNQLFNFLYYPTNEGTGPYYFGTIGSINLSAVERATCNQADSWCSVQAYGTPDHGNCPAQQANIYWSTIASPSANALYLHHALPLGARHDGYHEIPCTNYYQTSVTFNVQTPGCWWVTWFDPMTRMNLAQSIANYAAGSYTLPLSPYYLEDVALVVNFEGPSNAGLCSYPK